LVSWYRHGVYAGEIGPTLFMFGSEDWYHLRKYVNFHRERCWSADNDMSIHEVILHDVRRCCVVCYESTWECWAWAWQK